MLIFSDYIHRLRFNSVQKIVPFINGRDIQTGLEVGAGDGFQSKLLQKYLSRLVVTDLDDKRLIFDGCDNIDYRICDAEKISEIFSTNTFDLIYSSHLLEHLPNLDHFLISSRALLKADGISIHVVPSSWYAFFRLVFWYLSLGVRTLNKMRSGTKVDLTSKTHDPRSNNLNKDVRPRMKIWEWLFPRPHGISNSLFEEIKVLSKRYWKNKFLLSGYTIIDIVRGEVYTGYGFGFEKTRRLLFGLGISSEYIFILKVKDD